MHVTAAHAQPDDAPPSTPGHPAVEVYSPTFAVVSWQRSTDDRGVVVGYEVLRDGVGLGTLDALSYVDRDLRPGRSYDYVILAVDNAGQRSGRATVRAVTPDAVPSPATGVRAELYSRTAAELFWDRSPVFGQRYEIKRDGVAVATIDGTSYFDDTLTDARPHLFEVVALNRQGERSSPVRLSVDTADRGGVPPAPTGLRAEVYSRTAAELFWDRPDAFGLIYEVRRDGELLATIDGTSYFDDTLAGGTSYTYEVVAIDPEGGRSAPSSVMLSTSGGAAPPVDETSVISVDNHVELLGHLFDIFTGNAYGPAVLELPGYSDIPEELPEPSELVLPFVVTETCDNGGTAAFDLILWGDFVTTQGWVHDFDDCQDGSDVLDGVLSRADNSSSLFVSSPGYTLDTPNGRTRFRGNTARLYADARSLPDWRYWDTAPSPSYYTPNAYDPTATGVDLVLSDPDGNATFELLGASTFFGYNLPASKDMRGSFSIGSDATGGERLDVTTLEPFHGDGVAFVFNPDGSIAEHPDFETGVLQVSAENGDTLVLDADTGDRDTVRIEINAGGVVETLTQPWSLWRERLTFDDEFLGEF